MGIVHSHSNTRVIMCISQEVGMLEKKHTLNHLNRLKRLNVVTGEGYC